METPHASSGQVDPRSAESRRFVAGERVGILLPLPLTGVYDYRLPAGMDVEEGAFVRVPLGGRQATGVVWGKASGEVAEARLRDVVASLPAAPMTAVMRRFVDWVAAYTLYPAGAVLRMAMSVPEALLPSRPETVLAAAAAMPDLRPTAARARVMAVLADGPPRTAADLAREAGVSSAVVAGLMAAGALMPRTVLREATPELPDWSLSGPMLSPDQATAAAQLVAGVGKGFAVTVLDGVPGSGKTEVYFEAVAEVLRQGRQVLVMLPEIALSAQWLNRFRERFGAPPVEWHSELTGSRRRAAWRAISEGRAPVVVGARSALFLPFPDLGLIVVDEEHDAAFKQEDGVVYNGRDMAVVRARLGGIPAVLCSATPSLETSTNVAAGRYRCLHLPDRHGAAVLPSVELIDMRLHPAERGAWLSPPLREALAATLAAEEQVLLFLNRRGYAPLTLCRTCGHRMQCPRCTAWLVEHRLLGRLQCHHCGYAAPPPTACPSCAAENSLVACGPGVERLAEEIAALHPGIRFAVAASDTLRGPAAAADLIRRMEEHQLDLVIGTQVLAKGHHFPRLTLVGVVDADLGLSGGDLRAAERTYQLLYQVAGRAGRADRPGRVLMQTYMPEHPVMAALASGDRDRFIAAESKARQADGMPPFGRLVAIVVSAAGERAADDAARRLARVAPHADGVSVLGPAPAPLALLRGRHRRRLLLKAPRDVAVQPLVRRWLEAAGVGGNVHVHVDVDPYSFL